MYQPLLDKIKEKIAHWANHSLSYARKTILINSVLFGMQSFWGASVLLPKGVIKKINKLCKDFLWGIHDGNRRHVFMGWKALSNPKREGGIGIKEVLSWNRSQMMKWIWKLIHRPNSIWARWVYHYILKGTDFWQTTTSISHSWYWNNVVKMKDFLVAQAGSSSLAVGWLHDCSIHRQFNTGLMYQLLRQRGDLLSWSSLVHDNACIPKHSFLGMLVMVNKLPTIDNLVLRGIHLVNRCVLCCQHSEDIQHLFFLCPYSAQVWTTVAAWLHTTSSTSLVQVTSWFQDHIRGRSFLTGRQRAGLMATIYFLWKERNSRIFRGVLSDPEALCFQIKFAVCKRLSM
ncbi:uncharacterized protein LOC141630190 [Silene latifolia]|uniref:uncharacterized protein LOC141630190 n=1 Tax=Silene latifolia TaxID=37657 RepID=UPI003D7810F3